jgi:hypothetical protein
MPYQNIGDHTPMARDDLRDGVIQNIEYYLGQLPLPGSAASAKTYRTVATSAAINNVETLLLACPLVLPTTSFGQTVPGTLNVGTIITVTIQGTETNTVANTTTFGFRMGILGTVSDALVATFVTPVSGSTGTNIPFTAVITMTVQTLGATTGTGTAQMVINSVTAGIIGAPITFNVGSAAAITALPTTTATFFDVTLVSAATTTTNTIQSCIVTIQP